MPPSALPRPSKVPTVDPSQVGIVGVVVLPRTIHQDPRGFLVETMRSDDARVQGDRFAMTYTSVTHPGEMRDRDRWHVHQHQQDRFVVTMGEMVLALLDDRKESPSHGRLEVVRMTGAPWEATRSAAPRDLPSHLLTIPERVLHCIGNLHPKDPFVLQNFPTRLYDPADEGRVPFAERPVASLGGTPFSWERVEVRR